MSKQPLITQLQSLPWKQIQDSGLLYLPKVMMVVLAILLTKTLADVTWAIIDAPGDSSKAKITSVQVKQPVRVNSKQVSAMGQVSQYNLFGNATRQPMIQPKKVIDAPETRLRLTLKGVFASSNPKSALAIISSSRGDDKTYHIGDRVAGGAELHSIYSDRVILQRNGQLETLRLPKPKLESNALKSVPTKSVRQSRAVSPSRVTAKHTSVTADSSRKELRQIRDTLVNDPAKLWKQVRINPVMRDGKVKGYTLVHNNRQLMESINLKPTDIITQVDGNDLSDPASLYGLLNNLASKSSLDVTIERNGIQQMVQLNF